LSVKQQQLSVSISCVPPMVAATRPPRRAPGRHDRGAGSLRLHGVEKSGAVSSMRFTIRLGRRDATARQAGCRRCAAEERLARSRVSPQRRFRYRPVAADRTSGWRAQRGPSVRRACGGVGRAATPPHKRHGAARRPTTARSRRDDVVSRARAGVRATSGRSCSNGGCAACSAVRRSGCQRMLRARRRAPAGVAPSRRAACGRAERTSQTLRRTPAAERRTPPQTVGDADS
jgi:hypothetical protein